MPGLRSADSYRTWADLRDVLFEIVSAISSLHKFTKYGWKSLKAFVRFVSVNLRLYFTDWALFYPSCDLL